MVTCYYQANLAANSDETEKYDLPKPMKFSLDYSKYNDVAGLFNYLYLTPEQKRE